MLLTTAFYSESIFILGYFSFNRKRMSCPLWIFPSILLFQGLLRLKIRVYFWLTHTCTAGQSGPTHASSQKYHFHVMMDFCCAYLTMWLGGADWTRLWWRVISQWLYNIPWLGICLYQGPVALQKLFFKWCIIFHCRRHVLAPGPWGDMLCFPYWDLPETLWCIYPPPILLKP